MVYIQFLMKLKIGAVNLIKLTKKTGKIYIFGSFNDRDYDVITRVSMLGQMNGKKDGIA